ncbi:MAG: sodium/proline symporter [Planctomycetota bacterium]
MALLAVAFAVYTVLVIAVGLIASRFTRAESEEYFLASRTLGPVLSALSSGASGSSAWVTMGLVGLAFSSGVKAYWLIPGVLFGIAFNWFVIGKPMRNRAGELGAVTIPDLISMHFAERKPILRLMSVGVILSAMFLYVSAQMAAAGAVFETVFEGVPYQAGVGIGVAIVLAYTVVGGFRAAVWTDMVQSSIMLLALVAMPIFILASGVIEGSVADALASSDPELATFMPSETGVALIGFVLGSGALGVNFGYPGQPHVLVRLMALKDAKVIPVGAGIQISWTVLIYAGAITTGLLVRAAAGAGVDWATPIGTDAEGAPTGELGMIVAAQEVLPGVLAAFVLAAVFSAMASTADSQLIVAASAVSSDFYERLFGLQGSRLSPWLNRGAVLLLGIGAGVQVLFDPLEIYKYVLTYGWAILGASFGPQIALMLLWKRASYAGCIAGMATGFVVTIVWQQLQDRGIIELPFYNLTVAFISAMVVNVVVSVATPRRLDP